MRLRSIIYSLDMSTGRALLSSNMSADLAEMDLDDLRSSLKILIGPTSSNLGRRLVGQNGG